MRSFGKISFNLRSSICSDIDVELALPTLAMTDFFLVILAIDDPGDDPWADDNSNDSPCVPPRDDEPRDHVPSR